MNKNRLLLLITALIGFTKAASAQEDAGLYDDVAPPGSTFVRVINSSSTIADGVVIEEKALGAVASCAATGYVFQPANELNVKVGSLNATHNFEAGKFYSVVNDGDKLTVVKDPLFKNKRKAMLAMYNLVSTNPISLMAKSGTVAVVEAVDFMNLGVREINPVKIPMQIFSQDKPIKDVPAQTLARANVYSVLVCGTSSEPQVEWVKSELFSQ